MKRQDNQKEKDDQLPVDIGMGIIAYITHKHAFKITIITIIICILTVLIIKLNS